MKLQMVNPSSKGQPQQSKHIPIVFPPNYYVCLKIKNIYQRPTTNPQPVRIGGFKLGFFKRWTRAKTRRAACPSSPPASCVWTNLPGPIGQIWAWRTDTEEMVLHVFCMFLFYRNDGKGNHPTNPPKLLISP